MKHFLATFAILSALVRGSSAAQIALPIYLEDNHAGAFYWLAQHLDLEERCTLLHFDAHSDASAIFDSDKLRERLRRVHSLGERAQLLEDWRARGVVQCFNWIEPLMPAPIAQVLWIRGERLTGPDSHTLQSVTSGQLDGQLEAAPRLTGALAPRYRIAALEELEKNFALTGPLIASLDLDYFADLSPEELPVAFERVWKFICERRGLRAIVIAISRPYLKDDAQANTLVQLALRGAASLPTARLEFDPSREVGNDQSLRARQLRAQGQAVPRFRLTNASENPRFRVAIKNHVPSTDNIWRVASDEELELEVRADPWTTRFEKVTWLRQEPIYPRCNLISPVDDGALFARGAPPRPRWREVEMDGPLEKRCGVTRMKAQVDGVETPVIEIRRLAGTGFRAALTEQFGLPYLFGSGQLRDDGNTGPETGWGADCANFIVYALRRQGLRVPWSNPKQLRHYLEPIALNFPAAELERGLIVHFGSHVAAVMEDRPPLGVVNDEDLVAHQLEGPPEMISLGELMQMRGYTHFELLRVPAADSSADFVIGGDVMLGRSIGQRIKSGVDPFAGIRGLIEGCATAIVNLECVVSDKGSIEPAKQYSLRAPVEAAGTLQTAGIDVVGLANNHANDLGAEALLDSIDRLRTAGLAVIGSPNESYTIRGNVALFAINDVDQTVDRFALAAALERAQAEAKSLIALVHWGDENTAMVTERQRELARWLINRGVDLIAGSHPHCLQPLDFYHGRPVIYSLGNLVFDGAPTLASWNRGALLEVGLNGRSLVPRLIPIRLNADGFPRLEEQSADVRNTPPRRETRPTSSVLTIR